MFYESVMRKRRLIEAYEFSGFRPKSIVTGVFGAPGVRVMTLVRPGKKPPAVFAERFIAPSMIARPEGFVISPAGTPESSLIWRYDVSSAGDVAK
jgi:hypothetical protein